MDGLSAARRYLRDCGHAEVSGAVDEATVPPPFPTLRGAPRIPLPYPIGQGIAVDAAGSPVSLSRAVLGDLAGYLLGLTRIHWLPDAELETLSRTGLLSADADSSVVPGRPTPSGGRRYPSELYLASRVLPGLPAGLYRYAPARHALERLRATDTRADVLGSLSTPPHGTPDVILFLTSVFWRTAVRYGEYAYRLQALDAGALAGHALALGDAAGLHATIHLDFADGPVHGLLRVDAARENCQVIVTMTAEAGPADGPPPAGTSPEPAPPIALPGPARDVLPLSAALHAASARDASLRDASLRDASLRTASPHAASPHAASPHAASVRDAPTGAGNGVEACAGQNASGGVRLAGRPVRAAAGIPHRYSATPGFRPDPIRADDLAAILATACAGYAGDLPDTTGYATQVPLYVIANRVTGLTAGAYRYDPVSGRLAAVRTGDLLPVLAPGLTVSYPAVSEAGAVVVAVGDYERGFPRRGDRWYRMHTIGCGLVAERVCLAAAALRLGSHLRCDFDPAVVGHVLGLDPRAQTPVAMVLAGPPRLPLPLHVPLTLGAVSTREAGR